MALATFPTFPTIPIAGRKPEAKFPMLSATSSPAVLLSPKTFRNWSSTLPNDATDSPSLIPLLAPRSTAVPRRPAVGNKPS